MRKIKKRKKNSFFKKINLIGLVILGLLLVAGFFYIKYQGQQTMIVEPELLEEARKNLPGCDYILDFDTLKYAWASPKALEIIGYSANEASKMGSLDLINEHDSQNLALSRVLNRTFEEGGEFETVVKTKSGLSLKAHIIFKTFNYQGKNYLVGKVDSYQEISDEEAEEYYQE